MNQKHVLEVLQHVKGSTRKRNFSQSYDLVINLKNIDIKKSDQQLDFFVALHNDTGKKLKVGAFVGPELLPQARDVCDKAVSVDDFPAFADKKKIKQLANEMDFFIAQAPIMPKVAQQFGKVFGPRGKMPNPKLGCVVPPNANLRVLYDRLQKSVWVKAKAQPVVQVRIGTESMQDEQLVDNIITFYNNLVHHLPSEKNNIRSIFLKLTMGKPVRMDVKLDAQEVKPKGKQPAKGKPRTKADEPAEKEEDKPESEEKPE
jgi:large subunit ribosomal protein L1